MSKTAALIRRVADKRTVLMVEHNLGIVADLSDTITVLARGEVLAEGDYAAVSANPQVIEAYLGSEHDRDEDRDDDAVGAGAGNWSAGVGHA